jgi:hypothetical protein
MPPVRARDAGDRGSNAFMALDEPVTEAERMVSGAEPEERMTIWVLVVIVNLWNGPTPWPGWFDKAAYNMSETYAKESACWVARKHVLTTRPPAGFEPWTPVAATCVAVKSTNQEPTK